MVTDYDSDSTEGDFTETNVLLGYASKDADDDTISKLGGRPDWLDSNAPPSAALARCRACNDLMALVLQLNGELPDRFPGHERRLYVFACRRSSCRRREGSVRALRAVRAWHDDDEAAAAAARASLPPPQQKQKQQEEEPAPLAPATASAPAAGPGLGEALFGATALGGAAAGANPFASPASSSGPASAPTNPFGSPPPPPAITTTTAPTTASNENKKSCSSGKSAAPLPTDENAAASLPSTFAAALSLDLDAFPAQSAPPAPEPWPPASSSAQPKAYPTLFLAEADYETLDPMPRPAAAPADVRLDDADAPEPSLLDREAFESTMDAAFQKFADRLAQNPDQVIRYEFAGVPLLYSKTDPVGARLAAAGPSPGAAMPRCANCAGPRAFEVQLTPNAIAELEADDLSLEGMEWGTIILGVCERDCLPRGAQRGKAGYLEEWVGVQWEELTKQK